MAVKFDLSNLNLSAGTHTITVKARASGYLDSEPRTVIYNVGGAGGVVGETTYTIQANDSGGYTYIISSNEYTISNGVYTIGRHK